MPTPLRLDALLDRLGTPPREVCLDWAWQIEQLASDCLDQPLAWQDVQVADAGALSIVRDSSSAPSSATAGGRNQTARDLIGELRVWGGELDVPTRDPAMARVEPTASLETLASLPTRHQRDKKRAQSSTSQRPRRRARPDLRIIAAVLGVTGLIAGGWWLGSATNRTSQPTAAPLATPPAATSRLKPSEPPRSVQPAAAPVQLSVTIGDETISLPEPLSGTNQAASALAAPASSLAWPLPGTAFDTASTASTETALIVPTATASTTTAPTATEEERTTDPSSVASNPLGQPLDEELVGLSVLAELGKVAAATDRDETEQPLDATLVDSTAPLLVRTFPTRTIHRVPERSPATPRQPTWLLRLEVDEHLELQPEDPQSLAGRNTVAWRIVSQDAKHPVTAVHVTAQLVNPRSTAIRWSVAAIPEDQPQLVMPVGRETLDAVQFSLNALNQRMSASIDNLRGLVNNGVGLPSSVRSAASRQRRELETQLELGQRLLQVIADANQLAGMLGEQFQVHARLSDASQASSTALLQFGTPERLAPSAVGDATSVD